MGSYHPISSYSLSISSSILCSLVSDHFVWFQTPSQRPITFTLPHFLVPKKEGKKEEEKYFYDLELISSRFVSDIVLSWINFNMMQSEHHLHYKASLKLVFHHPSPGMNALYVVGVFSLYYPLLLSKKRTISSFGVWTLI